MTHSVIRLADCEKLGTLTFSPYVIRLSQKNRKSLLLASRELEVSAIFTQEKLCIYIVITIAKQFLKDAL